MANGHWLPPCTDHHNLRNPQAMLAGTFIKKLICQACTCIQLDSVLRSAPCFLSQCLWSVRPRKSVARVRMKTSKAAAMTHSDILATRWQLHPREPAEH